MKAKKMFMMGFLLVSLAASSFAAYQYATASTAASTECCFPGCCGGAANCGRTGN